MLTVINVEHVLAAGGDLRTIASYRGASLFYDAMASAYNVLALSFTDEEYARFWLKRERMPKWSAVYGADARVNGMTTADIREWQYNTVRNLLAEGWEIGFYVDVPTGPHQRIHDMGVTTLIVNRTHIIPGWQNPEQQQVRAWETLTSD